MKNKLQAIWAMITSKTYMVITPNTYIASYPKESNDEIIVEWAKAFEKWKKAQKENV